MKKLLSITYFVLGISMVNAQTALVSGIIVARNTNNPIGNLEVVIKELKQLQITAADGTFTFSQVPYGNYQVLIGDGNTVSEVVLVAVDREVVEIGNISVDYSGAEAVSYSGDLATIGLDDRDLDGNDDGLGHQGFSPILNAGRDPLLNAAAFTLGSLHYQLRGYRRNELEVFINGIPENDLQRGTALWSQWGGLNDMFRNQSVSFALSHSEFGFGGLQGSVAMDATAASQRRQSRLTYSLSNRGYRHRIMLTKSSGLMQSGWAYSISASTRIARQGYIPGTFYEGYSLYLGASRKLGHFGMLHLTTFGAMTTRGKAMAATEEAMELAGSHYYNPNWGYLGGKERNARVNSSLQPSAIVSYEYKRTNRQYLNLALSYTEGYSSNTSLDWYNAQDPRPDYYRKLPSYYLFRANAADSLAAEELRQSILNDRSRLQIDWGKLYGANQHNIETVNGVTGRRSVYVIGADVEYIRKISFAANYQKVIGEHIKAFSGLYLQYQHLHSYKRMEDLLGGDFYVNLNQFAERSYIGNDQYKQNNLLQPNELIHTGDIYSYNYTVLFLKAKYFMQMVGTYNKFDFFVAAKAGYNQLQRNGRYQTGLFADDSYGKSAALGFIDYGVKGGATYKIDGRNYLYINAAYQTNAPSLGNTFISPRTRNLQIAKPQSEVLQTIEGGYLLHAPSMNGRLSGFVTDKGRMSDIKRFYHEDFRTFVNYAMAGVSIRNIGAELALQAKVAPALSVTLVAVWMQVFYTSRPAISIYSDNDTSQAVAGAIVYMKDYFVASGPQSAYTFGLNYRSPKYWYANINASYFDRNYLDINPVRLTEDALGLHAPSSPAADRILEQKKLPAFFTVDIFAGKSFLLQKIFRGLNRDKMFFLNVGVNNILNNKNMVTGGFNQLRYDNVSQNPDAYPPKYFYGQGTNFFINLSYRF